MIKIVQRSNAVTIGLLIALVFMLFASFQAHAQSLQLGGWLSSKLFELAGNPDSQILFARTGQADSFLVFATSPTMVTGSATGATYTPDVADTGTATLHGTVTNLNGMPQATVGFRWGYSASNLSFNTSTTNVSGTGAYTITLSGFDQTRTVYFQAQGVTDGIAYGMGSVFTVTRVITAFTGFETVMTVTPLLIWLAIVVAMVFLFYIGFKEYNLLTRYIVIGLALVMLAVAIFLFPIVITVINQIRLL